MGVKLSNGTLIQISEKPIANGGEAELFQILNPLNFENQVLKYYKPEKRTEKKENKIKFLIENKSDLANQKENHPSVIWPIELVYDSDSKKFIGYTMAKASGENLANYMDEFNRYNTAKAYNANLNRFSFEKIEENFSLNKRLQLCFNISVALNQIHSSGKYVLVDMKPINIIVNSDNKLVSIIDIDSMQIVEDGKIKFEADCKTPDYSPPERINNDDIYNKYWDEFSMAIILYEILLGIHPFCGSLKNELPTNTIETLIKHGFLPVGINKVKFQVIPPLHEGFYKLDKKIQDFFLRAFEGKPEDRPSTEEWCNLLGNLLGYDKNENLQNNNLPKEIIDLEENLKRIENFSLKPISVQKLEEHLENPKKIKNYIEIKNKELYNNELKIQVKVLEDEQKKMVNISKIHIKLKNEIDSITDKYKNKIKKIIDNEISIINSSIDEITEKYNEKIAPLIKCLEDKEKEIIEKINVSINKKESELERLEKENNNYEKYYNNNILVFNKNINNLIFYKKSKIDELKKSRKLIENEINSKIDEIKKRFINNYNGILRDELLDFNEDLKASTNLLNEAKDSLKNITNDINLLNSIRDEKIKNNYYCLNDRILYENSINEYNLKKNSIVRTIEQHNINLLLTRNKINNINLNILENYNGFIDRYKSYRTYKLNNCYGSKLTNIEDTNKIEKEKIEKEIKNLSEKKDAFYNEIQKKAAKCIIIKNNINKIIGKYKDKKNKILEEIKNNCSDINNKLLEKIDQLNKINYDYLKEINEKNINNNIEKNNELYNESLIIFNIILKQ